MRGSPAAASTSCAPRHRPAGAVAEIALALGGAGINIVDIALAPPATSAAARSRSGCSGEQPARRAVETIAALDYPRGAGLTCAHGSTARFDPAPRGLQGVLAAPADKSVSHRAAILGAAWRGRARDHELPARRRHGRDARRRSGARSRRRARRLRGRRPGVGLRGAREPDGVIDVRNRAPVAPAARLARRPGGPSLHARRRRVDSPAPDRPDRGTAARDGGADRSRPTAPFHRSWRGVTRRTYALPVASAQVKSCLLLAGPARRRRHDRGSSPRRVGPTSDTERMWLRAGVTVIRDSSRITVEPALAGLDRARCGTGRSVIRRLLRRGRDARFAGCTSSSRGSARTGRATASSRSRGGWARALRGRSSRRLAARSGMIPSRRSRSDPHTARHEVEADEVPLAIDELPLVALLGAFAEGETIVRGAQELRVKETDRIATVVGGLQALGAQIEATARRFRRDRHGRSRRRHDQLVRRPSPCDARSGRRPGLRHGVEVDGSRGRARLLPGVHRRPRAARDVICAIDGPAGAGKSTVAKELSRPARLPYLDSGAMYRSVALASSRAPERNARRCAAS